MASVAGVVRGTLPWAEMFAQRTAVEVGGEIAAIMSLSGNDEIISFSGGFPDPATFPADELAEIFHQISAEPLALQYAPTAGLPGTLDWIAGRLERLEGLRPAADELIVTSGGIEGLELLTKSLVDPGDPVAVEGPSYLGAVMAFQGYEADVDAVPVDDDGIDVEAFDRLAARRRPKMLYTIPDYQNPAGVSMSTERRHALVAAARRHGVLLVEDVAYRELGFDDERRPSLWALAPDVTAQLGTFSKTFAPGFRMGWVAAPAPLIAQLVLAKQNTDQCTGALGQRLLEEYGRTGRFDSGVAAARTLYARRCRLMLDALDEHLPEGVSFTRPRGGFFTWVTAPEGVDTVALSASARSDGVAFVPGKAFYPDERGTNCLRLSFSKVADDAIPEGARRLGGILAKALESR
ncbi:MAG: PLP-dependent aminotransferase family protein [Streptosporangiaceae bacterium]